MRSQHSPAIFAASTNGGEPSNCEIDEMTASPETKLIN
jgi:hypothetical protein